MQQRSSVCWLEKFWSQEDWPPKPYYTPLRLDFSVKKVNISQTALLWWTWDKLQFNCFCNCGKIWLWPLKAIISFVHSVFDVEHHFDPGLSAWRQPVMIVIESSGIQNRVFYLVFTVVASEPDLSKVQQQQQQHLLYMSDIYNVFFISFLNHQRVLSPMLWPFATWLYCTGTKCNPSFLRTESRFWKYNIECYTLFC